MTHKTYKLTSIPMLVAMLATLATLATLAPGALAEISSTRGQLDRNTIYGVDDPVLSADFSPHASSGSGTSRYRGAARKARQVELAADDTATDLFNPLEPRDVVGMLANVGNDPIDLQFFPDGSSTPEVVTLDPGGRTSVNYGRIVDITATCLGGRAALCLLDLDLVHAPNDGNGPAGDIQNWFQIQHFEGSVSDPPDLDDGIACLWEFDTLWSANEPRTVELFIQVTGVQDLDVEIEEENGTIHGYSLCAGCLPNQKFIDDTWLDVVEIRVQGENSPEPGCQNVDYDYQITILP